MTQTRQLETLRDRKQRGERPVVQVGDQDYEFAAVYFGGSSPSVSLIDPDGNTRNQTAAAWTKAGATFRGRSRDLAKTRPGRSRAIPVSARLASRAQIEQEIAQVVRPVSESSYLGGLRYRTETYGPGGNQPYPGPVWRTRAPFMVDNKWQWVTWNHHHGNKHAAIVEKAQELGATAWDYGQADHGELGRVNF